MTFEAKMDAKHVAKGAEDHGNALQEVHKTMKENPRIGMSCPGGNANLPDIEINGDNNVIIINPESGGDAKPPIKSHPKITETTKPEGEPKVGQPKDPKSPDKVNPDKLEPKVGGGGGGGGNSEGVPKRFNPDLTPDKGPAKKG